MSPIRGRKGSLEKEGERKEAYFYTWLGNTMSEFEKKVVGVRSVNPSDTSSISMLYVLDSYRNAQYFPQIESIHREPRGFRLSMVFVAAKKELRISIVSVLRVRCRESGDHPCLLLSESSSSSLAWDG